MKRRLVVDYRRVSSRTSRAIYFVRRASDVVGEAAGSLWHTFLDAVAGFERVRNAQRARDVGHCLANGSVRTGFCDVRAADCARGLQLRD